MPRADRAATPPLVDLAFPLLGQTIHADHGYLLYRGLCDLLPSLRHLGGPGPARDLPVHPIAGRYVGDRQMQLTKASRLTLRIECDRIPEFLPLAGKRLAIGGSEVRVGVPAVRGLDLASRLYSRLVLIKGAKEPEAFLEAVRREMAGHGITGRPELLRRQLERPIEGRTGGEPNRSPWVRRTLKVREWTLVGYALIVEELSAEDSLRLQEVGLGRRRRFGCGVFVPARG